jgi:hypothetical protein
LLSEQANENEKQLLFFTRNFNSDFTEDKSVFPRAVFLVNLLGRGEKSWEAIFESS